MKVRDEIRVLEGRVKVVNYDQLRREREQKERKKRELENKVTSIAFDPLVGRLSVLFSNSFFVEIHHYREIGRTENHHTGYGTGTE